MPEYARACLAGGARFLQLRAKTLDGQAFLDAAGAVVELAAMSGALVIINDRADIARLRGAGGVHVGQSDLPPRAVRRVVGERAVLGLSTHTRLELSDALREPINYVAVGPVFGTLTKDVGHVAVGLEYVREAASRVGGHVPVVAIGGVTLASAAATIEAGAAAVAVISDLLSTGDPASRVREFLRVLGDV